MKELDERDQRTALAYVDGELEESERARFELRLAAEPELARAVEALAALDALARRAWKARGDAGARQAAAGERTARAAGERSARTDGSQPSTSEIERVRESARGATAPEPARSRRWLVLAPLLAAAAALVVWFTLRGHESDERAPRFAVCEGFATADEWLAAAPELAGLRPPGLGVARGGNDEPNIDVDAFEARARDAERALLAARATSVADVRAGFFVVPFECAAPTSVVVLAFPRVGGPAELLYPRAEDPLALDAGFHVVPAPRTAREETASGPALAYRRGFLVPIGCKELDVWIAWSPRALDGAGRDELAALLPSTDARANAAAWLASQGFTTTTRVVREP